ncbi:hypothetical protein P1X15_28485 [Runella sp. MFBS21]|uniref:hypothetical protein n=1 Tax=Runella sp. MFBS21 TaxID=3034018 RepID=UPI0023F70FBA|nr:hypothetical protein [Runella sp. MFBS21]MDF7821590.1 hypothetical protein [Runella sp. MFBS21]
MEESNKLPKNPIYNSSAFKWNLQDKASSLSAYTYMREGYNYSSPHYSSESSSLGTRNSIFTEDFLKKIQSDSKLSSEIAALKSEVSSKSAEVNKFKADAIEREAAIKSLEDANKKLNAKIQIQHIASRISTEANERLMVNSKFQELFDNLSSYETTVVSIDIRRSTELMLKAKNAVYFSDFINNLRTILFNIIISNYGVVYP